MENEITITEEQFNNLIKLSEIEITSDTQENKKDMVSRALIALERKLNYFNYPLSFFTAEAISVLIIDDTELSIYQLKTMLQKIGINVYVARTKEDAIAEFKKKHFDFLILDIYLPDYKDGFDLIREANKIRNEENRDFKIITVSGTDDAHVVQEIYKLEIDEFVPKSPSWHEQILKYISNTTNKITNEEYTKYNINDNICCFTIYKINNEKYIEDIIKEVNASVMTGKQNIIFNMEHIKIFSDNFASLFSEVYKSVNAKDGLFIVIRPCDDIIKALDYVFLSETIQIFNTTEEAVEYIEMNNFM